MSEKVQSRGKVYIALGANLANPITTFSRAIAKLHSEGVKILSTSRLYRSPAWPSGSNAPDYVNGVIEVATCMKAPVLMEQLLAIEAVLGRRRAERNAPRQIDLDLVDYQGQILNHNSCQLPHPRMHQRAFVLLPLSDIAHDWIHPNSGASLATLIERLPATDRRTCVPITVLPDRY